MLVFWEVHDVIWVRFLFVMNVFPGRSVSPCFLMVYSLYLKCKSSIISVTCQLIVTNPQLISILMGQKFRCRCIITSNFLSEIMQGGTSLKLFFLSSRHHWPTSLKSVEKDTFKARWISLDLFFAERRAKERNSRQWEVWWDGWSTHTNMESQDWCHFWVKDLLKNRRATCHVQFSHEIGASSL